MAYNSKYTGQEVENLLDQIPEIERIVNSHNKKLEFFAIEPVTVIVGGVEHHCEANQVATVFVGDEEFEIIPTSNNSIQSLLGYPIPLTWYDWLEGVDVFENIIFDMNNLDTYKHWIQYYQGDYHVQKAQYSNCVFWSDKPYTHSPFEARTNYTIYYSAELPMCYSSIPENTYKPFYLAYGVKTDPNWNNPDYVNSYSLVSGATQTFSYYGATAIGIFDMGVDIIKLPKDCRGLMYHAPAITHAGVFDAINTTNFGAKKGSWQEAFGDCISLVSLYIKNLKTSINISWSPINNESIEFILNNAANTSAITVSVSPYTWYRLTDSIRDLAKSKNITLALITTNYSDDARWTTKQDVLISGENIKTVNGQSILGSGDLPIDLSGYATTEALDGKVDKIEGKQLSTEDFTSTLKSKLEGLNNYDDTELSNALSTLRGDFDKLVSGDTTTAIKTFNEVIAFLDGIQDTQDLSSIIASIEQQVAGKMDKVTLATVATSGDYNDLNNKPAIPTKTSELTNDSTFITSTDNVASATKLQTMRYINGSPFDGTSNVVSYAVCPTGASTSIKTVNISNFSLITGSQVRVEFNFPNTASAPMLNVGGTGAKRMSYKGSLITNSNFTFYITKVYTFTYDGTYWVLEGNWDEAPKNFSDLSNNDFITCEFMGEVGDVILSDDDANRVAHIHEWMEALSDGKVCVLDFDDYEGTYANVHALNYRSNATYGSGIARFSYVFEGYLYEVEYDEVMLPVTMTIVSKTKIGGTSEGSSSAYTEVNHGTSDSTFELTPNTFHVWDEVASLDLSLGAETSGVANEYLFQFTSGSTPTTLTLPDGIKFTEDLIIEANKIYQISILKGLGSVLSWDNAPALIENKATYNEGDFMNGSTLTFEYPTASEIKLYLNYYKSPYLTIPAGTNTITIDWNEPSAPIPVHFDPSSDNTYIYIIA